MDGVELTEEERATIFIAPEFSDFVEHASKIMERALSDAYDYIRDYSVGAEVETYVLPSIISLAPSLTQNCRDDSEGKRVKRVCAFFDDRVTKNRSITDVDWSPKVLGISNTSERSI